MDQILLIFIIAPRGLTGAKLYVVDLGLQRQQIGINRANNLLMNRFYLTQLTTD